METYVCCHLQQQREVGVVLVAMTGMDCRTSRAVEVAAVVPVDGAASHLPLLPQTRHLTQRAAAVEEHDAAVMLLLLLHYTTSKTLLARHRSPQKRLPLPLTAYWRCLL